MNSLWNDGREVQEESLQRGGTCRGGRGRRGDGREQSEARSHSPRPTRASRVCSVGAGRSEVSRDHGGHVSRAKEDLTDVLPVRADFEEAELDDLTRRANCEKKRASNTC